MPFIPLIRDESTMTKKIATAAMPVLLMLNAAPVLAEDLIDIYDAAVQNDPAFQSQALTLKAEQQGPDVARADLLPDVRLSGAGVQNHDEASGSSAFVSEGSESFTSYEYGINLTQPLYDRESLLTYRQSKLQAEIAEVEFRDARQGLILRVVNRYLGVLAAQDNLELAVAERRAINRQLDLARSRLEVGLGTRTDLDDAKARFELAQAREIRAQQVLEEAQQALEELIGRRAEQLASLKEDSPLPPPSPNDRSIWVTRAQASNLELIAANLNEEIARREISRQEARRHPTLDLVLSHNVNDADDSIAGGAVRQDASEARLQLEFPLYQGGGISALSRQANYRYQAAQRQTESARRATTRDARSTFLDVTTSRREVTAFDQAVIASEQALESRQEGFEAGLNTNLDVLDAQRDLFQARRDYLQSRYEYIRSRLQLYEVVGELDIADLEEVNRWLEE